MNTRSQSNVCRCPLHRGRNSLERVSQLLKQDHRLSPQAERVLAGIVRDALAKVKR